MPRGARANRIIDLNEVPVPAPENPTSSMTYEHMQKKLREIGAAQSEADTFSRALQPGIAVMAVGFKSDRHGVDPYQLVKVDSPLSEVDLRNVLMGQFRTRLRKLKELVAALPDPDSL